MVSTFTPNIQLEEPARGDQVGVWDTPVNNNETLTDLVVGGITTISLNNSPVILAAAQFQSKGITFNSTLTGSVAITFPSSFKKSYEIQNLCTGSSAFVITLTTTAAGGQAIGCPPGITIDCFNDGTNIKFKNLPPIGTFWEYAGSSVPAWNSACTVPPWVNCDGSVIASSIYTFLPVVLGSSLLPDRRGNVRYTLNQGTGRLTTALGGLDGNTNLSLKTTQVTLGTSNLPPYTPAGSVTGTIGIGKGLFNVSGGGGTTLYPGGSGTDVYNLVSGTVVGSAQGGVSNVLPVGSATVVGITMIRAG